MTLFHRLLKAFGLYKEPCVASITKPMTAIVRKLEKFSADQSDAAASADDAAKRLIMEAADRKEAALEARNLSLRYAALTGAFPAE